MPRPLWQKNLAFHWKNSTKKKKILFDVSRVNEEKTMDKIIENLPSTTDDFYIIHETDTNAFSLRHEDGKMENKEKILPEAKNILEKLKINHKSVLFSEEKIYKWLLKKLKKIILSSIYC